MKKIIIDAGVVFLVAMAFSGCYQDVIMPEAPVDPKWSATSCEL
jgi:hypothetical protein